MDIKTFPLTFTEEELNRIGEVAKEQGLSKKKFILGCIEKEIDISNNIHKCPACGTECLTNANPTHCWHCNHEFNF